MKKATDSSYLIALDIAEKLVLEGIPFRTSHKIIGSLVQQAYNSKKPLNKLTSSEIKSAIKGTKLDPNTVSEIIKSTTIVSSLRDRKSFGSSSYSEQKRMVNDRIKKINDCRTEIINRENSLFHAFENLNKKISLLTK